jgi:hypothetical protein
MEEIMLKKITPYAALIVFAVGGMSFAQAAAAEVNYTVVFGDPPAPAEVRGATPELLTSIVTWLAANFDLPATPDLPKVEFARPLKLAAMRYKGLMPQDPSVQAAHQREVVAIYNDRTRTIFLSEGWTGAEPVERSVLVHEIIHHLQNLAKLKYECPAAREKLAYEAQSDWLKLHGLDLEAEFGVDLFTIFVTSACMN